MGTRFNIAITATDAATARVRAIKQAIGSIVQPITGIGSSIKALGKEVGIDKLAAGLGTVGKAAAGALKGIGGIGAGLAGAVGIGTISALAAYSKGTIYAQSATMRFAQISGVAATRVQTLRGAAELAGLSAEDMDGAVMNLGTTLQDARWGRNQGALMMMNRLGLQLKYTKDGSVDTAASLGDLADILSKMNAPIQTKRLIAQQFGVENLLPMLLKGRAAMEALERQSAKLKPPIGDEDLKKADQLRQKIDAMGQSFTSVGNAFTASIAPAIGGMADWITEHNKAVAANISKRGLLGAVGHGIYETGKDAIKYPVQKVVSNVKDIGNLISAGEGGYDSVNTGKKNGYKAARTNLVESSIDSIMAAQRAGEFNAAGKYQMTKDTLAMAVKALGIDTSQKFDQGMQERIFKDYLLSMKRPEIGAYLTGKSNDLHAAVKAASKEWASVADPDTGKSHYDGIANNKASITADQIAAVLKAARKPVPQPKTAPVVSDAAQAIGQVAGMDKREPAQQTDGSPPTVVVKKEPDALVPGKDKPVAGAPDLPSLWKNTTQKEPASDSTLHLKITGLPAGAKAEVVASRGPARTVLKVESSMPDYSL